MATKLFYTHPNSNIWFVLFQELIIFYLAFPTYESMAADVPTPSGSNTTISIGVIIDESTRVGKEQKTALIITAQNINHKSDHLKLLLLFKNSSYTDPLQAASAAIELSKEQVKAIIGMETWQEAALVAEVGRKYEIPVVSLAPAAPPTSPLAFPFLVQMDTTYQRQISCIAAMVKYYGWKSVVAVYEDDGHAGTSLLLTLLSQALRGAGSNIEHYLALPPLSVVNDGTKEMVLEEVVKVLGKQSRVFVVLGCSLPLSAHLFSEEKQVGLLGRETVWIVTESIAGLLDSANSTFISNTQGMLGIKSYYDETERKFFDFKNNFFVEFRSMYSQEEYSYPSIQALRAHDGITAIGDAVERLVGANKSGFSSKEVLEAILENNFNGLTGKISFNNQGELATAPILRVVNVVGKRYKDLDFWTEEDGFYNNSKELFMGLEGVDWPGGVRGHVPKGWAMPTNAKPLKIGVPGRTSFEKFVKVESSGNPNKTTYSGFCIDVFHEVVKILEQTYTLPYEFHAFYGTYDEMVDCVYNKTFDAVVGDVTILESRSKKVEFTLPYAKSGLSMIVPYKSKESQKAWLFTKPFTWQLWAVTGAVLVYTMLIVWLLEHKSNPEFRGSWKDQLSASLWFTFSSIFFLHREKIKSTYTRIVVVVWLVVVFVLTQSYTASLTSMLTVPILEPTVTDIGWLSKTKQPIGCDGDSFVLDYLVNVLNFSHESIVTVNSEYAYPENFNNHTILAAFLEIPYERVFLNQYCKDFTHAPLTYKFGGLGFVFQKGSPVAGDVSKAILELLENGVLKSLDDKWFSTSLECATINSNTERLSIQGFWVLYLFSCITSTACFLLYLFHVLRSYNSHLIAADVYDTVWSKLVRLAQFYDKGDIRMAETLPALSEWVPPSPPLWDYSDTPSEAEDRLQGSSSPAEIELSPTLN